MASPTAMITDFSPRAHANGKQPARTDRPASATLMPVPDVPRAERVWVMAAFLLGPSPATRSANWPTPGPP